MNASIPARHSIPRLFYLVLVVSILILCITVSNRITLVRRDAAYKAALAPYQHNLPAGTSRTAVQTYLASQHVNYITVHGRAADDIRVQIAEEPRDIFCDRWLVYIAFEFNATDALSGMHITKQGRCL